MPLTGAERARLCRQRKKLNEGEYARYLQKERDRYKKRKDKGEIKLINDMNEREQRKTRRNWRIRKQASRSKKNIELDTPPASPLTAPGPFPINLNNAGRRKVRKDRAKAYREIEKLKKQLNKQKRLSEMYRKRLYRRDLQARQNSPRTKTKILLRTQKVTDSVRKTLLFHNVLVEGIRRRYRESKSERTKQIIAKVFCTKLMKKYRMKAAVTSHIGLTQRRIQFSESDDLSYKRRPRCQGFISKAKLDIETFLCREDNSRPKAGKKSTKTKSKIKRQVYLLNDTLKNLHLKYLSEDINRKMSYSLFCRLKPFYMKQASAAERETCLCKRHENLQLKVQRLKQMKLLDFTDLDQLATKITCDINNKDCMYRQCQSCSNKTVDFGEFDHGQMVEWGEWKTKRVERRKPGDKSEEVKMVSITLKESERGTLKQLTDEFQEELCKCCKHLFNIKHQYKVIRQLKESLTEEECLIHIDFSENLNCKYSSEIQSMHFGSSQRQISLHTGVLYTNNDKTPFCSISDNLNHSPAGIFGHLKPVMQLIREKYPSISHIYFLSDGPTTQYRCKENFFLSSKITLDMGFKAMNWNFLEAGHGKGAPDGIGAVIKREADRVVSHGLDITDAKTLYETLLGRNIAVKLYLVHEEDIAFFESELRSHSIKVVPGTMKVHQVYTSTVGQIYHRSVSCFCRAPGFCTCYGPERADLTKRNDASSSNEETERNQDLDESLIGKFCVVSYDNRPYPGLVLAVDDGEVEVSVMHSIGRNRFFWPLIQDVLWYQRDNFITIIEEPDKVTNRHYQMKKDVWDEVARKFDL